MADDYSPAISPDEDEEQKKWQGVPYAYAPALPPLSAPPSPVTSTAPAPKYESVPQPAPDLPLEQAPGPQRPSWSQYAPAEKHGWGKVGSVLASLNPLSNEIVNERPMQNAERNYKAAASDFDKSQADKLATEKQTSETGLQSSLGKEAEAKAYEALHPKVAEPDQPLPNGNQANQMLTRRFQVLHPGEALPPDYVLPPNATKSDYARIDESLKNEEAAMGSKDARDTAQADRTQTHADAQANIAESRKQRQSNFDISREDRQTREEQARTDKLSKPTADEQRRSDLTENLNENLSALEEIVNRKPELFGPYHGRLTSLKAAIGTDDPDIAALETIKHQLGMAQISAHGMRSAQGISAASDSILNSFHNSPDAVRGAINAARKSVSTFTQDVERKQGGGNKAPAAGTVEGGYKFKGGDPSKKENWEKAP